MSNGVTILVFALFFLWLLAEVRASHYKRKSDAYEHNYDILRDLYTKQMKIDDEKDNEINRMIEKTYLMDKESKRQYDDLKNELIRLEAMIK